jgi:Reverse transcriptase (RNA-dependent DNA polymerase)
MMCGMLFHVPLYHPIADVSSTSGYLISKEIQVPGIDFMDAYSPVINDVVFRIMIVIQMIWKLNSKIIDVETAFIHGELDHEIYMDCLKGLDHKPADCLVLKKSLYGLVQSARQFFKKLLKY